MAEPMDAVFIKKLPRSEIAALVNRLVRFGTRCMRQLNVGPAGSDACILGKSVDDFVQCAFEKTLNGTRKISPNTDLYQHLRGVVRSDISHAYKKYRNKVYIHHDNQDVIDVELHRIRGALFDNMSLQEMSVYIEQIRNRAADVYPNDAKFIIYVDTVVKLRTLDPKIISDFMGVSIERVYEWGRKIRKMVKVVPPVSIVTNLAGSAD